jgi:hypothetical protein
MKSRRMRCVGHMAHVVVKRNMYKVFMGKSEGRTFGMWDNNIKLDLQEIGW